MSQYSVGKEVLSYCSKCKLTLAHMVVAMKDSDTIAKVMCKTCKGNHAYKDPNAKKAKKVVAARKAAGTSTGRKRAASVPLSDLWLEAMNNTMKSPQAYSIRTTFELGDVIDHPKFGQGIVEKLLGADKIEVMFKTDYKTLVHSK